MKQTGESFEINTSVTYVATRVRQHDAEDNIRIGQLEGRNALVLEQELAGRVFQTWIYHYNGILWELFISEDGTVAAGLGQELVPVYNFTIDMPREDLIYVSAESQSGIYSRKLIGIRSGG